MESAVPTHSWRKGRTLKGFHNGSLSTRPIPFLINTSIFLLGKVALLVIVLIKHYTLWYRIFNDGTIYMERRRSPGAYRAEIRASTGSVPPFRRSQVERPRDRRRYR